MLFPDDIFSSMDYRVISQNCFSRIRHTFQSPPSTTGGFLLLDGNEFSLLDGLPMSLLSTTGG